MKLAYLIFITGVLSIMMLAQQDSPRPPRGQNRSPGQSSKTETLTADQKSAVNAILAKYNQSSLTAKDAKAINEAFRSAGLRNGPALHQAIREAGFVPEKIGQLDPPANNRDRRPEEKPSPGEPASNPGQEIREPGSHRGLNPSGGYSIEQATSDRAQLNTIAFDGLAFLTGSMGCNTFLPPGKVADFCGFQYMRDVDRNQLGHNTSFVPRAANNILFLLTSSQRAQLVSLAHEQERLLIDFAYRRYPLIKAFYRLLEGSIPSGSPGLNRQAVMKYTAGLYELDGRLSCRRAEVLGGIIRSLNNTQKAYLSKMAFSDSATWPDLNEQLDKKSVPHTVHVAVMTYASEMFSWYAGNLEADVYFCPERHATYFGSFYMKDIPAMGNPGYSISESLTGDSGEAFLAALTGPQRRLITGLVDQQRMDLAEIVRIRRAIAAELRRFMTGSSVDQTRILNLSKKYGELDGEISFFYARAFAEVARTLTASQKKNLFKLRNLDTRFDCKGAYLYSSPVGMPAIPDTDFLFTSAGAVKSVSAPGAESEGMPYR